MKLRNRRNVNDFEVKNKTETIKVATVRSRQCSTPSINSADNFDVAKGTISNTHTVSPANFHSSKIPADILEMLKVCFLFSYSLFCTSTFLLQDEKLSKALSAAAKRVRANGGGPSDFLLEAESIKKIYNSHFTSTLSHESTKTDTKEVKMVKTKESSTVATQGITMIS